MSRQPALIHLPASELRRGLNLARILSTRVPGSWARVYPLLGAFRINSSERRFVTELAWKKSNLWVFRCHQRMFCGDFALVDMSAPSPARRRVWITELKSGQALKSGAAGRQMLNHARVLEELCSMGLITAGCVPTLLQGSAAAVLQALTRSSALMVSWLLRSGVRAG